MSKRMQLEMVREEQVEKDIFALLQEDPLKSWNVSRLKETLGCSRMKIEKAVAVLQRDEKIFVEHLKPSWVIRLHPRLIPKEK